VVTKDIPANALVMGNPAKIAGWMCWCGEKLEFDDTRAVCTRCERTYGKKGNKVEMVL